MVKRSLYYLSKMYEEQLNEKEDYSKLARNVCINVLKRATSVLLTPLGETGIS